MKKIVVFLTILLSTVSLYAQGDLHIFTVENKNGKVTPMMLQKAFTKSGFEIGINSDIHHGLTTKYGSSGFAIYNAISLYHKDISKRLIKEHSDAGIITPMGVAMYQKTGENNLYISVVTAETQAKILGVKTKLLKELETAIVKTITKTFPTAKHGYNEDSLKDTRTLLTKYSKDLKGEDYDDARETLEENFEEKFNEAGFVMPSYFDFSDELGDDSPYDFYVTYSICKMEVIKSVSKARPEAAAFAPCTTMLYKKKNEDKIVMGFTAVYNWLSSGVINDKASKDALMKAQTDFEAVLKSVTE